MNDRLRVWSLAIDLLFEPDSARLEERLSSAAAAVADFWGELIALANVNLVTATLWTVLRERGLDVLMPAEALDYLQSFHAYNSARNKVVRAQLLECIRALNAEGIQPMPLKGAHYLLSDLYANVGDRMFADIDLLVPEHRVDEARGALERIGYRLSPDPEFDYTDHHHLTPLVREDAPAAVELHMAAAPDYASRALPASALWRAATTIEIESVDGVGGVRYAAPDASHEAMLCFLHTEIVDRNLALLFVPMRPFYDMLRLESRHGDRLDWKGNFCRAAAIGAEHRLRRFLFFLDRIRGRERADASLLDAACFAMCRAAVAWPTISNWVLRAERLTDRRLRERYGADGTWALAANRIRELAAMLAGRLPD